MNGSALNENDDNSNGQIESDGSHLIPIEADSHLSPGGESNQNSLSTVQYSTTTSNYSPSNLNYQNDDQNESSDCRSNSNEDDRSSDEHDNRDSLTTIHSIPPTPHYSPLNENNQSDPKENNLYQPADGKNPGLPSKILSVPINLQPTPTYSACNFCSGLVGWETAAAELYSKTESKFIFIYKNFQLCYLFI